MTLHPLEQIARDLDAAYERLSLGIEYLRTTPEPDWQDVLAHLKLARQCLALDPGDRVRAQAAALAAAQAERDVLRAVVERAEWGASEQGAPMGSMWHNTPGPMIPACPICRGVHPEKGAREFMPEMLGHRPDCPFAALGGQS